MSFLILAYPILSQSDFDAIQLFRKEHDTFAIDEIEVISLLSG